MGESRLYPFILNQWIIGKDETYVKRAFEKRLHCTSGERNNFVNTTN